MTEVRKQRYWWIILIGIVLIAGAIRIGELETYTPTPGDDVSYLNNVIATYARMHRSIPDPPPLFKFFAPVMVSNSLVQKTYHTRAFTSLVKPLYILKLAIIEGTVGLNIYRQQLTLAVAGVLSVIVVFLIGRALFGNPAGLIAAFLMAVSPWAIRYSTYGIPTGDSLLFLLLAVWILLLPRNLPFLTGLFLGIAVMFNPTVAWASLLIAALAAIRSILKVFAGDVAEGKMALIGSLLKLALGFLIIPILWEFGNLYFYNMIGLPYRLSWAALRITMEDNLSHALLLPVDPLFWFRLIIAGEGWPQLILWLAALIWVSRSLVESERKSRFSPAALLMIMLGVIISATWSGSTQCARHYFLAWPLGLVAIGGLLTSLPRLFRKLAGRKGSTALIVAIVLLLCLASAAPRFLRYRSSRRGGYLLTEWVEENIPVGRVVVPANQPPNMWPGFPRFNNWDELEELEERLGAVYIIYGDYLAITRGIWDYPYDMFLIAQACRAVDDELYRAGTHLSDPAFLYENEDYYWGFSRQKIIEFNPDVRVIPAAAALAFRDDLPRPESAVAVTWQHANGDKGHNIYLPFVEFTIHAYRSPLVSLGLMAALLAFLVWYCWPKRPELYPWLSRHYIVLGLLAVLIAGLVFRSYGLSRFTQMGGDDVKYQLYIERGRAFPKFRGLGISAPFIIAAEVSNLDVSRTITSFAKPFFILERCLLEYTLGSDIVVLHFWACLQGIATILLVFFVGRMVGGVKGGFLAAALWVLSPWAVTYSTWGIHVAGGTFWFATALWGYLRYRKSSRTRDAFLAGLLLGVSVMYSPTNLWPAFCLLLIELVGRFFQLPLRSTRRGVVIGNFFLLIGGLVVAWLSWELISWLASLIMDDQYLPYPLVLWRTMRDNVLHAGTLKVDLLFFWRHLFVSEGPIVGLGAIAATLWAFWAVVRRRASGEAAVMLALFFGVTVAMNYTGGSQVIRNFFPAWLPLTVLMGWGISRLSDRKPYCLGIAGAVVIVLLFTQWHRLRVFRLARWAPGLVRTWAQTYYVPHYVATLACQDISLWPTLQSISSWEEVGWMTKLLPPGVLMYSDYIELSFGSWFYSKKDFYEISEVARRTKGELYRTPSYLSYRPSLFENEFYYWGLYRDPFSDFDPAIRLISSKVLQEELEAVRSDPERLEELWAPARKEPPLRLPARPDDIQRPFMAKHDRSSYRVHLAVSLLLLLVLAWLARPTPLPPEQKNGP